MKISVALSASAVLLVGPVVGVSASRAERSLQNNKNDKNAVEADKQEDKDKNQQQDKNQQVAQVITNTGGKSWSTTKECNCWE